MIFGFEQRKHNFLKFSKILVQQLKKNGSLGRLAQCGQGGFLTHLGVKKAILEEISMKI